MALFSQRQVENLVSDLGGKASKAVTVTAGLGLSGGGSLAASFSLELTGISAGIHQLAAPGLIVANGTTAYARTLVGTTNRISVTNGNGVAGNPTFDLSPVPGLSAGTATKITFDQFGRVTASDNPTTLAGYGITDAIGGSGGTLGGPLGFSNSLSGGTPTLNALSAGTRILLRDTKAVGAADFAIGWNTDRLWFGVSQPIAGQDIAFYAGSTLLAKIAGDSVFTVYGQLKATTKSFLIPHPSRKGWELEHGSLEGPEHAVFVRGRLRGKNKIELPKYWLNLVNSASITVHLTSRNKNSVWVKESNSVRVVVGHDCGSQALEFDYLVVGERVDISPLVPEQKRKTAA